MKVIVDSEKDAALILDDDNIFKAATTIQNFSSVLVENAKSFETGFMPQSGSGILSYRVRGSYSQLAYQEAPGIRLVKWGRMERDVEAQMFELEHPYKIWICDFDKDLLVGLRHFFSPIPIEDVDQELYHTTFPNTNCIGYSDTSVGWVCLYQTGTDPLLSMQDKLAYAYEREAGHSEPYNDRNMSSTDGPRFYANNGVDLFASGSDWVAAQKEGIDWESVLIPVRTTDEMSLFHDPEGAEIYTFNDALNKPYYPYYKYRLSEKQRTFYEASWGSDTFLPSEFDNQSLSRLASVEVSSDVDLNSLISNFSLKQKTSIDFDAFGFDEASTISKLVLASRESCCLCGQYGKNLLNLVDTFVAWEITPQTKKFEAFKSCGYYLARVVLKPQHTENMLKVCTSCEYEGFAYRVPFEEDQYLSAEDNSVEHAYVFSGHGLEEYKSNNEDSEYLIHNDDVLKKAYSQALVRVYGQIPPYPETMTAQCNECELRHLYKIKDDSTIEYPHLSIPNSENPEYLKNIHLELKLDRCPQCLSYISHLGLEMTHETAIQSVKYLYDVDSEDQDNLVNDMGIQMDASGSFVPPTKEAGKYRMAEFAKTDELYITEYLGADTTEMIYFVDTLENLKKIDKCQCGISIEFDINQDVLCTLADCEYKVCKLCVKDGQFSPILNY